MEKILIGSRVLNLQNCKDYDYFIIDNNVETIEKQIENNVQIFKYNRKYLDSMFNFENFDRIILCIYQFDKNINKACEFLNFNILEHIEDVKRFLNYYINKKRINGRTTNKINYHIAYLYFIIVNNNIELTKTQFDIVQRLHDEIYIKEIRTIIKNIKNNNYEEIK